MANAVQLGASRQEHYKKARNTTKKMTNPVANKMTIRYTSSLKKLFLFQTEQVLKESLHMFDTKKTNRQTMQSLMFRQNKYDGV